jgi:bcr-type benzoyl-CoA reductase subunit C
MRNAHEALAALSEIADDPYGYAERWKRAKRRKVVGVFPMNFPPQIVHAAGALPIVAQEHRDAITVGRTLLPEFYCGYTRSISDQAAKGQLDVFDAFLNVDHCISLLGAVDTIRFTLPDKPAPLTQFVASMDEPWSYPSVRGQIDSLRSEVQDLVGATIAPEALSNSIRAFNRNRQLLRQVYDRRRSGRTTITATTLQVLVKSSMVMDIDEHTAILSDWMDGLGDERDIAPERVPIHLSGHFCHAPKPELLDAIEECGATIVDDDLYTGFRYISTDVPEDGDPFDALARWYFDRNVTAPDATRVQNNVDWDGFLLKSLQQSGAAGVIVLMVKFCEPHMLYYPELRKALDRNQVPHLLIETEHEGIPIAAIRTRVEAFLERIHRGAKPTPATARHPLPSSTAE